MLAKRGGLGSARTKKQLEEWYQRKKQLHKKIKEKRQEWCEAPNCTGRRDSKEGDGIGLYVENAAEPVRR